MGFVKNLLFGISSLAILLYIILEAYFGRTISLKAAPVVKKFESTLHKPALILTLRILSYFPLAVLIVDLIIVYFRGKLRFIGVVFYLIHVYFVTSIMQMLYREPKPYFESTGYLGYAECCNFGYSDPSEHVLLAVIASYFFIKELFVRKNPDFEMLETWKKVCLIISLVMCIILTVIVLIARLYLGTNYLNQVFFGLALGLYLILLHSFCLKELFKIMLRWIESQIRHKENLLMFWWLFLIYNSLGCVPIFIHLFYRPPVPVISKWEKNISENCKKDTIISANLIGSNSGYNAVWIFGIVAYILATFTYRKTLASKEDYPPIENDKIWKKIIKLIIIATTCGGIIVGFFYFNFQNFFMKYFLSGFLPLYLVIFIYQWILPWLFRKLDLLQIDDTIDEKRFYMSSKPVFSPLYFPFSFRGKAWRGYGIFLKFLIIHFSYFHQKTYFNTI